MAEEYQCVWCATPTDPTGQSCSNCSKPVLAHCVGIWRQGERYVYGPAEDDTVAVWDLRDLPQPVRREPREKSDQLERVFVFWENQIPDVGYKRQGIRLSPGRSAGLLVPLLIGIGIYVLIHALRYQNCLFQPGIFAWPAACL